MFKYSGSRQTTKILNRWHQGMTRYASYDMLAGRIFPKAGNFSVKFVLYLEYQSNFIPMSGSYETIQNNYNMAWNKKKKQNMRCAKSWNSVLVIFQHFQNFGRFFGPF